MGPASGQRHNVVDRRRPRMRHHLRAKHQSAADLTAPAIPLEDLPSHHTLDERPTLASTAQRSGARPLTTVRAVDRTSLVGSGDRHERLTAVLARSVHQQLPPVLTTLRGPASWVLRWEPRQRIRVRMQNRQAAIPILGGPRSVGALPATEPGLALPNLSVTTAPLANDPKQRVLSPMLQPTCGARMGAAHASVEASFTASIHGAHVTIRTTL